MLRAGVGAAAPRSRGTVARLLKITVRRVARLERSGLRRLRSVCGAPVTTTTTTEPVLAASVTTNPAALAPKPGSKPSRTATPTPSREAEGAPPSVGDVAGRSATNLPSPAEGGPDLLVPVILVLLGLAGFVTGRLMSRPAAVASEPVAEHRPIWSDPPSSSSTGAGDWTAPPTPPNGRSPAPEPAAAGANEAATAGETAAGEEPPVEDAAPRDPWRAPSRRR